MTEEQWKELKELARVVADESRERMRDILAGMEQDRVIRQQRSPCPNCGVCPACGRGGFHITYVYPQPVYPVYPLPAPGYPWLNTAGNPDLPMTMVTMTSGHQQ